MTEEITKPEPTLTSEQKENNLKGDTANLVTAFAVILAVQYATESPDIWDGFIGVLSIILGVTFFKKTKTYHNWFTTFLISALIGLGAFSIFEVVEYVADGYPNTVLLAEAKFTEEFEDFKKFFLLTMSIFAVMTLIELRKKQ